MRLKKKKKLKRYKNLIKIYKLKIINSKKSINKLLIIVDRMK